MHQLIRRCSLPEYRYSGGKHRYSGRKHRYSGRKHLWQGSLFLALTLLPWAAMAVDVRVGTREQLVKALQDAKPGTKILIAPGTYKGGLSRTNLKGAQGAPIIIAGEDPAKRPVIEGATTGLQLSSPEHVELRDLVISKATGNGINIDDSGSTTTPARNVVLKNILVRDIGPTGNKDGLKLSGVNDFHIEGCRVERWGSTGSAIDMVGCHQGVVNGCKFLEGASSATGVQAKGGSSEIVIQRCRFENPGERAVNVGGSTGLAYFRPIDAKFEAASITVEDCEFIGGLSAIAFVGVDGALVQHNTIYRPRKWVMRILQENTGSRFVACRNGQFIKNVVAFRSDEVGTIVNIGPNTEPKTFAFSGNKWYCLDRPGQTQQLIQLPTKETSGIYGQNPGFTDAERGDLSIKGQTPQDPGVRPVLQQ